MAFAKHIGQQRFALQRSIFLKRNHICKCPFLSSFHAPNLLDQSEPNMENLASSELPYKQLTAGQMPRRLNQPIHTYHTIALRDNLSRCRALLTI